jgi:FkbM family methyltransferase
VLDRRAFMTGALAGASGVGLLGSVGAFAWREGTKSNGRQDQKTEQRGSQETQQGAVSYSQMGEDLVVWHLLAEAMRIERPTYVDIGAADPIEANNTYLLYSKGSHGVLVEPNPAYQERLRQHRPRDIVVNAGAGTSDAREADYYVIRNAPMRNTFSKEDVEDLRKRRGQEVVERVIKIPLISINRLMADHLGCAPDLLSTDVEGLDYAILKTLDFDKYRPAVVIAESQPDGPIPTLLRSRGYEMRGASMNNVIFADPRRYVRA